jgi:transposase
MRSYDGILHIGYQRHCPVRHDRDELMRGGIRINGIEGFWGFAKTRLVKFGGMSRSTLYLHLKECKFRFNHRNEDLYSLLRTLTRSSVLT